MAKRLPRPLARFAPGDLAKALLALGQDGLTDTRIQKFGLHFADQAALDAELLFIEDPDLTARIRTLVRLPR